MVEDFDNEIAKKLEKVDEYAELTGREKADIIADILDDGILNQSNQSKDTKISYQDSVHQGDHVEHKVDSQTINDPDAIARIALASYKQAMKDQEKHSYIYPQIKHPRHEPIQDSTNSYPQIQHPQYINTSNQKISNDFQQGALIDLNSPIAEPIVYAVWLFLGLLGGHRFLLGHWGMGVLYMFTFGGFMIAWFADFPKLPELISTARKDQGRLNLRRIKSQI
jgi:hypothetical protein